MAGMRRGSLAVGASRFAGRKVGGWCRCTAGIYTRVPEYQGLAGRLGGDSVRILHSIAVRQGSLFPSSSCAPSFCFCLGRGISFGPSPLSLREASGARPMVITDPMIIESHSLVSFLYRAS